MNSPARTWWQRKRVWVILIYLIVLLVSHLLPQQPAAPSPPASPTTTLLLCDPLDASNEAAEELAARLSARTAPLPGLNRPERGQHTFSSLADLIATDLHAPTLLIANGDAGSVGLQLAARYPDQVSGLILLDASGVEELNLLGEYHLNHGLHAISYYALRLADALTPRFPVFQSLSLRKAQLGLLLNSDRRTLRPLLKQVKTPVLILAHSDRMHVSGQLREHLRLLPHSQSAEVENRTMLTKTAVAFASAVRDGRAPLRDQAVPDRVIASQQPFDPGNVPQPRGGRLILVLVAIALATLISEDLTCVVTGVMIANGNLNGWHGVCACLSGILLGDYLLYLAGRFLGRPFLKKPPLSWMVDPLSLREAEQWFRERGGIAILISRFLPGTRLPVYIVAGLMGMSAGAFTAWFAIAAMIWTPTLVWVAVQLSEQALSWINRYHHTAPAVFLGMILLYQLFHRVLLPACNWRGRRMLAGRWRRFRHPEYWPTLMFYWPIALHLLARFFRPGQRALDFTACNPCMPASGFVEESKSDILSRFRDQSAIADYIRIPGAASIEQKIELAQEFTGKGGYPVVLKPDVGQRGAQVTIAKHEDQLRAAMGNAHGDFILQAYIVGQEFGVFYTRHPNEDQGTIFAVTLKEFYQVTGDGHHTLEDLILKDPRGAAQFKVHNKYLGARLFEIPEAGSAVALTDVGNHSRGTLFREGAHLITPALEQRLNEISLGLPGFHYGRYDLIAPDEDAFRNGRDLKIIELNGVTSEATNLYDPDKSYREMLGILRAQWQICSGIGQACRERGEKISSVRELLKLVIASRKRETAVREQESKQL